MFISKEVASAYDEAPRFDESRLYGEEACLKLGRERAKLDKILFSAMSSAQWKLFQEYVGLLYEECELECMHYYEQGWLAAQRCAQTVSKESL